MDDEGTLLTVTLHPLVDETVQERATVVAEGGAAIGVDLKLVLGSGVLQRQERHGERLVKYNHVQYAV